jgi:hypothetical protein
MLATDPQFNNYVEYWLFAATDEDLPQSHD